MGAIFHIMSHYPEVFPLACTMESLTLREFSLPGFDGVREQKVIWASAGFLWDLKVGVEWAKVSPDHPWIVLENGTGCTGPFFAVTK